MRAASAATRPPSDCPATKVLAGGSGAPSRCSTAAAHAYTSSTLACGWVRRKTRACCATVVRATGAWHAVGAFGANVCPVEPTRAGVGARAVRRRGQARRHSQMCGRHPSYGCTVKVHRCGTPSIAIQVPCFHTHSTPQCDSLRPCQGQTTYQVAPAFNIAAPAGFLRLRLAVAVDVKAVAGNPRLGHVLEHCRVSVRGQSKGLLPR